MADHGRVVTAKLPEDLVNRMDEVAERIERNKSWIVREALSQWLAEEQRRHDLTVEALKDVDEGRVLSRENLRDWGEQKNRNER